MKYTDEQKEAYRRVGDEISRAKKHLINAIRIAAEANIRPIRLHSVAHATEAIQNICTKRGSNQ
jgi:hypothetical protein